jgi:nitroreductase
VPLTALEQILEAARWSPTAHNMQNFEFLVIDAKDVLAKLGDISSPASEVFIRENFEQLAFSEEELRRKKVGILGTMFPAAWRTPGAKFDEVARDSGPSFLRDTIRDAPTVLIVIYDARKRAPASEGDVLGFMSLGCAMENMWLVAQSLGIGCQIMSVFSGRAIEEPIKQILDIPGFMKIGFAARLGYPVSVASRYVRVRRDVEDFAHHNRFGAMLHPVDLVSDSQH